nr:YfhO family protein [Anaerolineae bacterium]
MTVAKLCNQLSQGINCRRAIVASAIVLPGLVLVFYWKMAFTDLILPRGDMYLYFYPYWHYRDMMLSSGHIPLWNPYLFMGAPFLANSQAGVLYPLNWPLVFFDTPIAVKISIILHVSLIAIGTYLLLQKASALHPVSASLGAAVFALGGYYTAQVEHINQIQGLCWLPWLLWLWSEFRTGKRKAVIWLGIVFALQLLAGHTQTSFISGVVLGLWAVWHSMPDWWNHYKRKQPGIHPFKGTLPAFGVVISAMAIAIFLAAAQLLPTLELTGLSNRGGGLSLLEAVSFSFDPRLIGPALLPDYNRPHLYSEYIMTMGTSGLVIGLWSMWRCRRSWHHLSYTILAGFGLFLGLGAYNPAYWLLVRYIPGFDLFRTPARWLILFSLGMAALVAVGVNLLFGKENTDKPPRLRDQIIGIALPVAFMGLLIPAHAYAQRLANRYPGISSATVTEILLWIGPALLTALLLILSQIRQPRRFSTAALIVLVLVELFAATRVLPQNNLSASTAWSSQRPAISWLLYMTEGETPPPRFLALSDIFYDPGDLREMQAIFGEYLDEDAVYDYIVSAKYREILAPNLPLAWGIPAIDGFDGGILPTRDYILFTSLFLPENATATDGRLRENLDNIPGLEWLRLANVGYIITDKLGDRWIDGVYYDTQFPAESYLVEAYPVRAFEADSLGIIVDVDSLDAIEAAQVLAEIRVEGTTSSASVSIPLVLDDDLADGHVVLELGERITPQRIVIEPDQSTSPYMIIEGLSLIDSVAGTFIPTSISQGNERKLAYSADVKAYSYTGTLPRAYIVCNATIADTDEEALAALADDPNTAVIVAPGQSHTEGCSIEQAGSAVITSYEAERVVISTDVVNDEVWLILSDAYYPGWEASVDGVHAPIYKANGMFRALQLLEGQHEIVFEYQCRPFQTGAIISCISLFLVIAALIVRWPGQVKD